MKQLKKWAVRTLLIIAHRIMWQKFVKFHQRVSTKKGSSFFEFSQLHSIEGVDIIMDPLNGEDSVRGFDLLRPLGRIIYFGMFFFFSNLIGFILSVIQVQQILLLVKVDH